MPEPDDSLQALVYALFLVPIAFLLFVQYWPRYGLLPLLGG
jgi:hypothetical protein